MYSYFLAILKEFYPRIISLKFEEILKSGVGEVVVRRNC